MPAQTIIQMRQGTAAQWTSVDPILATGEKGFETDTNKFKIGDGASAWSVLGYFSSDSVLSITQAQVTGLIDSLLAKASLSGNTFTGANTFNANVTVTGNLVTTSESRFSAGTYADPAGGILAAFKMGGGSAGTQVALAPSSATKMALLVRGVASQSGNLTEWQDSSGAVKASISAGGAILASGTIDIRTASSGEYAGTFGTTGETGGNNKILITTSRGAGGTVITSVAGNMTTPILAVKGIASQSANLQEWQNSSGTTLSSINSGGDFISINGFKVGGVAIVGQQSGVMGQFSVYTVAPTSVGAVIRGAASQTANLQEWQDSSGAIRASISPTGVTNIGSTLTFANPGVGNDTRFNFTKSNDAAWLSVLERTSDNTTYEFGMADNPDGGDYFQWRFNDYNNASSGWMPLQIAGFKTRLIASSTEVWGNLGTSGNTPFFTTNDLVGSAQAGPNVYKPQTSSSYELFKDYGSGSGVLNVDMSGYTSTSVSNIRVTIDTDGTTFKWGYGTGSSSQAAGVPITGEWQALALGINIKLSLTGHVAEDRWAFRGYPVSKFSVGGAAINTSLVTVLPPAASTGIIIRGAASQTANLQEWQNSAGNAVAKVDATGQLIAAGGNFTGSTLLARTIAGSDNLVAFQLAGNRSVSIGTGVPSLGGGAGVAFINNATTVPASNPTGGGVLYSEGGALKWRGSNGTVTTIAAA
jgi:hypothetical protein